MINCHNTQVKEGRGRGRSRAGAAGLQRRSTGRGRGRKGEEEGEGGADRWAPVVSDSEEKRKEEVKGGPLREEV
jgi:hypothetical protein